VGLTLSQARAATVEKPALLGGKPSRTAAIPSWPIFDRSEEQALLETVRSRKWFRGSGNNVNRFETAFAELIGAKFCVGTSSGTNALIASLNALGVGAGDEVILPPFTFVACPNAILMLGALPVFVDTDRETFQIDARKIEGAITERTAAIMPVHLGGNAADLDAILGFATKHKLPIVEDACQAHLGEWRKRKLGTFGQAGCFSFQASKNLTAGEGGMIATDDPELAEKCFASHNNSRPRKAAGAHPNLSRGSNLRMSEFHAGILLAQMKRLPEQARKRDENGAYLNKMLSEVLGIVPARAYDGATRNAYHLYMFRYEKEQFANLPRAKFLAALSAEGVPASAGYQPLNKDPFITRTVGSTKFQRAFSERQIANWTERNFCPENDRLCEEAVWLPQNVLLAERGAMEQIVDAIRKIQTHAADLARA
jgi:dTDP-4-amino-4,6-dideoxygalactose transaminase